jgi:hypothetical protein
VPPAGSGWLTVWRAGISVVETMFSQRTGLDSGEEHAFSASGYRLLQRFCSSCGAVHHCSTLHAVWLVQAFETTFVLIHSQFFFVELCSQLVHVVSMGMLSGSGFLAYACVAILKHAEAAVGSKVRCFICYHHASSIPLIFDWREPSCSSRLALALP